MAQTNRRYEPCRLFATGYHRFTRHNRTRVPVRRGAPGAQHKKNLGESRKKVLRPQALGEVAQSVPLPDNAYARAAHLPEGKTCAPIARISANTVLPEPSCVDDRYQPLPLCTGSEANRTASLASSEPHAMAITRCVRSALISCRTLASCRSSFKQAADTKATVRPNCRSARLE